MQQLSKDNETYLKLFDSDEATKMKVMRDACNKGATNKKSMSQKEVAK